ncbi:MAG TPA: helix-turn-helix domain-containing protein [Thermoplasmatales archaeon]|nr:helix-turn-helix domain-containing protein [Thermoplasmatales archaeon]
MKKTPCEEIVWTVLPCIRKKLAENLIGKGLKQKEVAEKLGVSTAAISQYISDKRGNTSIFDNKIENEIKKSADSILNGGDVVEEICRICRVVKKEMKMKNIIC